MKRQLAAILYADVAGYSRLTGQNEEQTHQLLNEALTLLTEAISTTGGSKVHEAGDAILAEFPSVTEAVDCAFGFQKSMVGWKPDLPENERVEFRIGIHITRTQRDWLVINLAYPGLGETVTIDQWQCIDAFHQKHMRFETWNNTQVLVDSFQNCYVLDNKEGATSFVTFGTELEEATDADPAADPEDASDAGAA